MFFFPPFCRSETMEDVLQTQILKPTIQMQDKVFEREKKLPGQKRFSRGISEVSRGKEESWMDFLGPFPMTLQGKGADLIDNSVKFAMNLDRLMPFMEE
ncbi:hypothetical protein SRHO_G00112760 [Serrasalmus rhombeus]